MNTNDETVAEAGGEAGDTPVATPDSSTQPSQASEDAVTQVGDDADGSEAGAAPGQPAEDPRDAQLVALTAERDKVKEQLLRTAADFDNYRRRARREVEDARSKGKDDAIIELLPVLDNLERAVAAAQSARDIESVVEGVRMVLKLFEDTSERIGLQRVPTVGERFDPAVHDAIQQLETDAHDAGTIITEVTAGYQFGKRLLRAAMVVVARPPAKPVEAAAEPPEQAAAAPAEPASAEEPPADEVSVTEEPSKEVE